MNRLHEKKTGRRMRLSSYDRTGKNDDHVVMAPNSQYAFPEIRGEGIIRHIWFTLGGEFTSYEQLRLKAVFDDCEKPGVDCGLSDFFVLGHGELVDVNSAPIQVSRQPHIARYPYFGSLNCYFPMPFEKCARFSLTNDSDVEIILYFYIDYELYDCLPKPVLHFHATANEEFCRPPTGSKLMAHGEMNLEGATLSTDENYRFLDAKGYEGHYVGTALFVHCRHEGHGKWWEGDDMLVIDGEPWPPRLHGTGTEDYFNLAWGFRKVDCRPEYGVTYIGKTEEDTSMIDGRFSLYRFHVSDPIAFEDSIAATIEHGHANDCEVHYRSVAYWYGRKK